MKLYYIEEKEHRISMIMQTHFCALATSGKNS